MTDNLTDEEMREEGSSQDPGRHQCGEQPGLTAGATAALAIEDLLGIARAATQSEWSMDHICFDQKIPIRGGVSAYGRPYTIAHVNRPGSSYAGRAEADAKFIVTFQPARVIALLGRLKASEDRHDERDMFDAESEAAANDLDATIEDLTARAIAAEAALQWIAKHDNHGLTDGSAATRVCLDAIVQRAKDALNPSQEA